MYHKLPLPLPLRMLINSDTRLAVLIAHPQQQQQHRTITRNAQPREASPMALSNCSDPALPCPAVPCPALNLGPAHRYVRKLVQGKAEAVAVVIAIAVAADNAYSKVKNR